MKTNTASTEASWVDPDDAPELTAAFFAEADLYDGARMVRAGRPPSANPKQLLTLRVDPAVVKKLRASGPGWQTRTTEAIRQFAESLASTSD